MPSCCGHPCGHTHCSPSKGPLGAGFSLLGLLVVRSLSASAPLPHHSFVLHAECPSWTCQGQSHCQVPVTLLWHRGSRRGHQEASQLCWDIPSSLYRHSVGIAPLFSTACPDGFYGLECQQACHCLNGARCDHVTGQCHCAPGWEGPHCAQGECHSSWAPTCCGWGGEGMG